MTCRMCKSERLSAFLDLGFTPPADQFRRPEQMREPETAFPLQVLLCVDCGLAQLSHVVSPEVLYRNDYPYESSITATGRRHWGELAASAITDFSLSGGDLVVDIGCNVGVLLEQFRTAGCRVLGIDPAANIVRIAEKKGIECLAEFFSEPLATAVRQQYGPARLVTATNVFAHVDDLDAFMRGIGALLADDGVFVVEAPAFTHLVEQLEYDTIYHEHLSYLSLTPLVPYVRRLGFEVFDVAQRDIHGGSARYMIGRAGRREVRPAVTAMLESERRSGIHTMERLRAFSAAVETNRRSLSWLIHRLTNEGKRVVAVSAPAKGMTLLNFCRLGPELIEYVTEKSTLKIGRFTPGMHIPVVEDSALLQNRPDFALLLAWNFADEIMANLKDYRRAGGRFIVPIPEPRIVE
jgi:SAM-dependent methyltransferase